MACSGIEFRFVVWFSKLPLEAPRKEKVMSLGFVSYVQTHVNTHARRAFSLHWETRQGQ